MTGKGSESGLSGVWTGEYWYGVGESRTPFVANLVDMAGGLTGTSLEEAAPFGELSAVLTGARTGFDVGFTKVYDEAARMRACPIAYSGIASADLDVIEGDWVLMERNPLRGGFRMRRISPRGAAVSVEKAEELVTVRR